ncbi:hypothetical protein F2P56_000619 [Juglans regia]|uniref:Uncharacterized protein n=1 Tax=Juglans regia TaxID=51240 RepID=A0A834D395_JUGRE|nr:hypothetical protein F2P56_000619 [Juglans regia]
MTDCKRYCIRTDLFKIMFIIWEYVTSYVAQATTVSKYNLSAWMFQVASITSISCSQLYYHIVQEAVAVTTAIQEEIFLEMGVDPAFGLSCLGKVNVVFENDQDLMIRFYRFLAKEEMACDEAELGPEEFAERILSQQKLQEQLHQQMENDNYEGGSSVLSSEQIQEIVQRRVSPLFRPR